MKGLFNYDNIFFSTLMKIFNMVIISAMWVLFCIPVFTAGASTCALYYSVQKWLKYERSYAWTSFWDGFKRNFKQATLGNLIFLALVFLVITDYSIVDWLAESQSNAGGLRIVFVVLIVFICTFAFWYFAIVARFENTMKNQLKNTLVLMGRHFPTTLALVVIGACALLLMYLGPYFLIIVPAIAIWLMSLLTERIFRRYMSEEDKKLEDELNMNYKKDYKPDHPRKGKNR